MIAIKQWHLIKLVYTYNDPVVMPKNLANCV